MALDTEKLKQLFRIFDQDRDGLISVEDIGTIARCLGKNVAEADVQDLMVSARATNGSIDEAEMLRLVDEHVRTVRVPSLQEIVESFRVFDKDRSGLISTTDFRTMMLYLGETLPESEVDRMLAMCPPREDGMVEYEAFVKAVAEAPGNTPLIPL